MLFFHLVLILMCDYVVGDILPTVEIPQGVVSGTLKKSYKGRTYAAFEGIPYARPPVGDLRFQEPVPADGWDGVLLANQTYMCMCFIPLPMFHGAKGQEDCLYLYIYVPRKAVSGNENFDVVIHIHGGAFMLGSPSMVADPTFIMDKDVVYVTMNYRLGILGFLSTEDEIVPGNNGLKDQSLALKWIKNNIKSFGGNPDSITLTGLSAGGASFEIDEKVIRLGLFHRGFSQSGTAFQSWALVEEPLRNAQAVANALNCPIDDTAEMVNCLRQMPGPDLVNAIAILFVFMELIPFTPFGPVVETGSNAFLSHHPYKLLKEGNVADLPWITSNTRDEGIFPVGFFLIFNKLNEINEKWSEIMPYALDFHNTVVDSKKSAVIKKITDFYFTESEHISHENIYKLVQLFTDRAFTVDCEKAIRLHSQVVQSPVYYYKFSYILAQLFIFPMKSGVAHGDDGKLMWKMIASAKVLPKEDEAMADLLTEFIANYAKTGIPTFSNVVDWKPLAKGARNINYLHIRSDTDARMETVYELAPTEMWQSLPIQENDKLF